MSLPSLTIKSARVRLALTYLAIIMVLSIGFSAVFYHQSVDEARRNLQRQQLQLRDFLYFTTQEGIQGIQDGQLVLFRNHLLKRLVIVNLGMLLIGSGVSYVLARRSLRPLEEALVAQSRFTSDAAHELRTPLTAMKTEIEVAMRAKSLEAADAKELFASNLEEIAKLETLTSALLRLAKRSEAIDMSQWHHYKLEDVLGAAEKRVGDMAQKRKVTIERAKTKVVVFGDSDQLTEMFVTLLANAIKYSPQKSIVKVVVREKENKICVDVIDKGIGIAEVDLPHIFDRFYRADQSRNKSKAEGYGLGLSLAKAIADAHGAKIKVKSKYGKGSTFTVLLARS